MSDQQLCVSIRGKAITLPVELKESMCNPNFILLREENSKSLWISKTNGPFFPFLNLTAHRIARLIFNKPKRFSQILHFSQLIGPNAEYTGRAVLQDADFRIINYHPNYYLVPVDLKDEDKSREAFWANIHNYHEHLDPASQDTDAQKVSQWLAQDIMKPLAARSFLELGCGSGRNLLFISREMPTAEINGLDINSEAVAIARDRIKQHADKILTRSIYETEQYRDNSS